MKKSIKWAALVSLLFLFVKGFAVDNGSQWIYTGFSPSSSGKGFTGVGGSGYAGDIFINPANPAFDKRLRIFGQYGIATPNFLGNVGVSLPLDFGILTAALQSIYFTPPSVGSVMSINIGFAKMILDDFAFGFNVHLLNQSTPAGGDMAIGLDMGMIFQLKDKVPEIVAFGFRDTKLGLALTGIGKAAAVNSATPMPGLGLKLGVSTKFLDAGWLKTSLAFDTTFHFAPLNIFANLGLKFTIADHFNLMGGLYFGNNGIGDVNNGNLCFTLGASFQYQFDRTPVEIFYSYDPYSYVSNTGSAAHFIGAEVAFGLPDTEAPKNKIEFDITNANIIYFSPNFDGAQDNVKLNMKIDDMSLIGDWKLKILNSGMQSVKTVKGIEARDISLDFAMFWQKLWEKKESVKVPDSYVWDGTTDNGTIVEEGNYYIVLESMDEEKNTGYSATNKMIVDLTPPSAALGISDNLFSPNGDGNKDTVVITQELSAGDYWKAELRNVNGLLVKSWEWGTNPPKEIVWDGKDSKGIACPDGSYDYLVFGKDLAGNKTLMPIKNINLSTANYSIFIALDRNGFSPNNDGNSDNVKVTPTFSDTTGIVKLTFTVTDDKGNAVRTITSTQPPAYYIWDGKDDKGMTVPDGKYFLDLKTEYANGNTPKSETHPIIVDTLPPSVSVQYDPPQPFSPDHDGDKDAVKIKLTVDDPQGIKKWKMVIYDPDNKPFKTFGGEGAPAPEFSWDGRSDNGELVESAQDYKVKITIEDNIGNKLDGKELPPISVDILVEATPEGLKIRINNIEFETGKANLTKNAKVILDRVAEILKKYSGYSIQIQGHTDNTGPYEVNQPLSLARAEAVKKYLITKGIAADRMTTVGFADTKPIADNSTPEGKRKNRRVEFILIKKE